MKIKIALITIVVLAAGFILLNLAVNGYQSFSDSYLWIAYTIFAVFTLPSLISKSLFKQKFFGFYSSLLFLIYPTLFIIFFGLSQSLKLDLKSLTSGLFAILIIAWNYLLIALIAFSKEAELKRIINKYKFFIVIVSILVTIFVLVRQPDSIVSLDYLQHQAVINSIFTDKHLCIIPSECSNLFLQDGYTTIYHYVLSIFGTLSSNSIEKTFYILDLVWWIVGSLVFYNIFSKFFYKRYALLSTLLATLVFTNWAYEFNFFIPQTLAFFFFLNFLYEETNSKLKLLVSIALLVATHFIMGTYLSVFLLIYYIFTRSKRPESTNFWITSISIATATLAFLLHLSKFSFESAFQAEDIKIIGGITNAVFPDSANTLINILGFGTLVFLTALTFYVFSKYKNQKISLFISFVFICIASYFIGPTYAAKFFIGISLYSTFLIINFVKNLKFEKGVFILVATMLVGVYCFNFISNYKQYLDFYSRESNIVSAISPTDKAMIDYLHKNEMGCLVVSDPYTQLLVTGLTNYDTANAQYMNINTRVSLSEFIKDPTVNNYRALLANVKKVDSNSNVCFLYTSRLQTSFKDKNEGWVNNIYQYITDNRYYVDNVNLDSFFKKTNRKAVFSDSFYTLYN